MSRKSNMDADIQTMEDYAKIERERAENELVIVKTAAKDTVVRTAEAYEIAGRIQAFTFIEKVVTVSTLMQLNKIKESKVYRDLDNIGTWEKYCDYLKLDRHTTDERLRQLNEFGSQFLETATSFGVTHRDLRKLRQLSHDGTITIDADAVEIKGERIPLDSDHKEDLQAAIEQIIEEQALVKEELAAQKKANDRVQADTHKSMVKLQKELSRFTAAAEAKGLTGAEDAFVQLVEKYRIMAQGSLIALEPLELVKDGLELTPRMKAKAISTVHELKMQILALYDTVVTEIGDPVMNPELLEDFTKWEQKNGFN